MSVADDAQTGDLPPGVRRVLDEVVQAARRSLGERLRSIVLFGSAAEGRLRATSDVNLAFVLSAFEREAIDGLREALRLAEAAVRLKPLFLLTDELGPAALAFAAKFTDLRRRRRVLWGDDPFAALAIPRDVQVARLRQSLLDRGCGCARPMRCAACARSSRRWPSPTWRGRCGWRLRCCSSCRDARRARRARRWPRRPHPAG
jgi:predicted nucleotidyltransferase